MWLGFVFTDSLDPPLHSNKYAPSHQDIARSYTNGYITNSALQVQSGESEISSSYTICSSYDTIVMLLSGISDII